jgi:hypothetical protein
MLDKIRLKAAGKLPPEYFTGVEDPTHFDALHEIPRRELR